MVIIKPTFWRPGTVVGAVVIGAICLYPLVLHVGVGYKLAGLGVLMGMALMSWLLSRPIQLEITENEVRAKEGWTQFQRDFPRTQPSEQSQKEDEPPVIAKFCGQSQRIENSCAPCGARSWFS